MVLKAYIKEFTIVQKTSTLYYTRKEVGLEAKVRFMLGGHKAKLSVNVSSVDGGKGLSTDNRSYNFSTLQPTRKKKKIM